MIKYYLAKLAWAGACIFVIALPNELSGQALSPVEFLYDSVQVKIYNNYTAEITYTKGIQFNQAGIEKYSIIRVPVNQHIEFKLLEVSTKLLDGRKQKLERGDIETISDFTPSYYPESKTKIIYIPSPRAGAVAHVSYQMKYKNLSSVRVKCQPTTLILKCSPVFPIHTISLMLSKWIFLGIQH